MPMIPHMSLAPCLLQFFLHLPEHHHPARLLHLLATGNGEGIGRHVPGDHAAGGNEGARADGDRRTERAVGADEGPGTDDGLVLAEAVVVAGNGAGADIRTLVYPRTPM